MYWGCPGGSSIRKGAPSDRYNLMDEREGEEKDSPCLECYRFCVVGAPGWVVLQVKNVLGEDAQDGDTEMELDFEVIAAEVADLLPPHSPKVFSNGMIVERPSTPLDGAPFPDGNFNDLLVTGRARLLCDPKTKSNIERLDIPGLIELFLRMETIEYDNIHGQKQIGFNAENLRDGLKRQARLAMYSTKRGMLNETLQHLDEDGEKPSLIHREHGLKSKTGEILRRFKCAEGGVDVLVGTSLVEEGLDLHLCERVIAYSMEGILHSGKSLIQNAGRARKEGSDFYVLCDGYAGEMLVEDKQDQVDALERMLAKDLLVVDSPMVERQ